MQSDPKNIKAFCKFFHLEKYKNSHNNTLLSYKEDRIFYEQVISYMKSYVEYFNLYYAINNDGKIYFGDTEELTKVFIKTKEE